VHALIFAHEQVMEASSVRAHEMISQKFHAVRMVVAIVNAVSVKVYRSSRQATHKRLASDAVVVSTSYRPCFALHPSPERPA